MVIFDGSPNPTAPTGLQGATAGSAFSKTIGVSAAFFSMHSPRTLPAGEAYSRPLKGKIARNDQSFGLPKPFWEAGTKCSPSSERKMRLPRVESVLT
jgi:hypothetical protein